MTLANWQFGQCSNKGFVISPLSAMTHEIFCVFSPLRLSAMRMFFKDAIHTKNATLVGVFTFHTAFEGKGKLVFPLKTS